MVAREFHSFVPLLSLARAPRESLSSLQRQVVDMHTRAVNACIDFKRKRREVTKGASIPLSNFDTNATGHSILALREAVKYYAHHGQVDRAYTELRDVAQRSWHPSIRKAWPHYFAAQVSDLGVHIPASLASKLKHDRSNFVRRSVNRAVATGLASQPKRAVA